jgi:HAMP domain-containing protein
MRGDFDAFITTERELSTVRHEASVAASRTAAIAAVIGILASLVLIVAFATYLGRVIVRPVRSMAIAAGRIAAGDLNARASDVGVAEIGTLGRSFNTMAASVERTQAELARVAEEQSALRRVATLVARGVAPADVFAAVTEEVGVLLDADLAHMARFETDGTATGIAGWSRGAEGVPIGRHVSLRGESATASVQRTGRAALGCGRARPAARRQRRGYRRRCSRQPCGLGWSSPWGGHRVDRRCPDRLRTGPHERAGRFDPGQRVSVTVLTMQGQRSVDVELASRPPGL